MTSAPIIINGSGQPITAGRRDRWPLPYRQSATLYFDRTKPGWTETRPARSDG